MPPSSEFGTPFFCIRQSVLLKWDHSPETPPTGSANSDVKFLAGSALILDPEFSPLEDEIEAIYPIHPRRRISMNCLRSN